MLDLHTLTPLLHWFAGRRADRDGNMEPWPMSEMMDDVGVENRKESTEDFHSIYFSTGNHSLIAQIPHILHAER